MKKSEQTKRYIIETIAPIFNSKGYFGTSLNDIMDSTGLSKGCIYGNFDNKDEIALKAFEYNHELVNMHFHTKFSQTENSIERLLFYPYTYKNFFRYPFLKFGCPILNTAIEADDCHPFLKKRAAQALDFWKTAIVKQIKRGISRNEIKSDTQAEEIATIMISLIEGALMQSKLSDNSKALKISMNFLEKEILKLKI